MKSWDVPALPFIVGLEPAATLPALLLTITVLFFTIWGPLFSTATGGGTAGRTPAAVLILVRPALVQGAVQLDDTPAHLIAVPILRYRPQFCPHGEDRVDSGLDVRYHLIVDCRAYLFRGQRQRGCHRLNCQSGDIVGDFSVVGLVVASTHHYSD